MDAADLGPGRRHRAAPGHGYAPRARDGERLSRGRTVRRRRGARARPRETARAGRDAPTLLGRRRARFLAPEPGAANPGRPSGGGCALREPRSAGRARGRAGGSFRGPGERAHPLALGRARGAGPGARGAAPGGGAGRVAGLLRACRPAPRGRARPCRSRRSNRRGEEDARPPAQRVRRRGPGGARRGRRAPGALAAGQRPARRTRHADRRLPRLRRAAVRPPVPGRPRCHGRPLADGTGAAGHRRSHGSRGGQPVRAHDCRRRAPAAAAAAPRPGGARGPVDGCRTLAAYARHPAPWDDCGPRRAGCGGCIRRGSA